MGWSRGPKASGLVLVVVGVAGLAAGHAGFFSDPDRLALWREIEHSAEGTDGVWLLDPHDVPPAVTLAKFRPGAESFKMRFPVPRPPIEGTLIGGLRVRRDGGTDYYVFEGVRLPAAATDEGRMWAVEWPYRGWDAALLIVGMVLAVLGVWIERAHVAAPPAASRRAR